MAQLGRRSTPDAGRCVGWRLGVLLAVAVGVLGMHGLAGSAAACSTAASMTPSNRIDDARSAHPPSAQMAQLDSTVMVMSGAGSSQAAAQRGAGLDPQGVCVATTPRTHQLMAPALAVLGVAALAIWLSVSPIRPGRPRPPPGVDRSLLCVSLT